MLANHTKALNSHPRRRRQVTGAILCALALLLIPASTTAQETGSIAGSVDTHGERIVLAVARIPALGPQHRGVHGRSVPLRRRCRPAPISSSSRFPAFGTASDSVTVAGGDEAELQLEMRHGTHFDEGRGHRDRRSAPRLRAGEPRLRAVRTGPPVAPGRHLGRNTGGRTRGVLDGIRPRRRPADHSRPDRRPGARHGERTRHRRRLRCQRRPRRDLRAGARRADRESCAAPPRSASVPRRSAARSTWSTDGFDRPRGPSAH